ncbi:MAG: leucine-rich repeat domain-containing protein [Clostridium sp.]
MYVEEAHNCDGAFEDIHSITKLTIPDTVKTIGWDSFSGLNALKEVKLPNDLTELGNSAFYGCDQLKKVTIGASLTSLNTYAFDDCPKLKTVRVSKSNHVLYAKDNMLIKKETKFMQKMAPVFIRRKPKNLL